MFHLDLRGSGRFEELGKRGIYRSLGNSSRGGCANELRRAGFWSTACCNVRRNIMDDGFSEVAKLISAVRSLRGSLVFDVTVMRVLASLPASKYFDAEEAQLAQGCRRSSPGSASSRNPCQPTASSHKSRFGAALRSERLVEA